MQQSISQSNQPHPKPNGVGYSFAHSTWITKIWNWFLELMGRAAEAILVVSVLYASAKLLPVVHMPATLDVVVFIAQFVALDVGGLSLGKLAKQAKADGNTEGATQASRMSSALIFIMIAGVVVVAVEQLFSIPGEWRLGIDTILLVARSILAVLYGHIIHTLKQEDVFDQTHDTFPRQVDLQAHLSWSLVAILAMQQAWQTTMANEHASLRATVQDLFDGASTVDQTGIVAAVIDHFSEQFETAMTRLTEQSGSLRSGPTIPALPEHLNTIRRLGPTTKMVPLAPRSLNSQPNHKEAIFALLQADQTRGPRELARLAGCSPATAKSYRDQYLAHQSEHDQTADETFG